MAFDPPHRQPIYRGKIIDVLLEDERWEIVRHASAVAVLVRDGERVLGVRQFRPAVAAETWELPAGLIDAGEAPETAAARELAEEVQLGGRLTLLSRFFSSPGFTDEEIYLFEATEVSPAAGTPEPDEDLRAEWRDLEETWAAVREGRLKSSSPTVLALALARGRA
jgi:ADP-ribose pyrophosphatase